MSINFLRLLADRSGNFAITGVVLSIPLLLAVGLGIDYTRHSAAARHLQELADGAALALAATEDKSEAQMRELALDMLAANTDRNRVRNVVIARLDIDDDRVDLALGGEIPTTFMGIAGIETMATAASALAERAVMGNVEVALILDNTWSMSEEDARGVAKIEALKEAADNLVDELLEDEDDGAVKIGLVPYADYVNVGVENRGASWLSIPDDYTIDPKPRTCETRTEQRECMERAATYSCEWTVDGVTQRGTCGGGCTRWETKTVEPYQSCSGGGEAREFTWHGCVGSRIEGNTRLHDQRPQVTYPGFVTERQRCLNPIMQLSTDEDSLRDAVDDMIINIGGYKPYTYIPAGLIWGLNLLNPGDPFGGSAAYDPDNRKPRKVAVLMTDGENTLRFDENDGTHDGFSGDDRSKRRQLRRANRDTVAICDYMKEQNIEIYTVAFMLDNDDAKEVLVDCATDAEHFYDASDSEKLIAAFSNISDALRVVRLAR